MTNDPASARQAADLSRRTSPAGPERAVAATKTYTAELLALWLLVDGLVGGDAAPAPRAAPGGDGGDLAHGTRWRRSPPLPLR